MKHMDFIKKEKQKGVAAVEFAIVLPLLLFLFIGITEFGIAYYNKQVLTNASREGARAGTFNDKYPSEIQQIAYNYANDRIITFGPNSFSTNSIIIGRDNSDNYDCDASSDYCRVGVEFSYSYLILQGFRFFGADFGPNLNIGASTTMRMM